MEPPGSLQGWQRAHMGGRDLLTANGRKGAGNTPGQSKQPFTVAFPPQPPVSFSSTGAGGKAQVPPAPTMKPVRIKMLTQIPVSL